MFTINEVLEKFKGRYTEIEVYEAFKKHFTIENEALSIDELPFNDYIVIDYDLMDAQKYNEKMLSNCGETFQDLFNNNDIILVLLIDENWKQLKTLTDIEILMLDHNAEPQAKNYLKNGTIIFNDFEENYKKYAYEWACDDIEERDQMIEEFEKMIATQEPLNGWGVVNHNQKRFYIMYSL